MKQSQSMHALEAVLFVYVFAEQLLVLHESRWLETMKGGPKKGEINEGTEPRCFTYAEQKEAPALEYLPGPHASQG